MTTPRAMDDPPRLGPSLVQRLGAAFARFKIGNDTRDSASFDAVIAFAIRVGSAALLYLLQIILARWIGTTEFGTYVLVWTWVLILGGLSHLGMSTAMIRLLPTYIEHQDWPRARGLQRGGRLLAIVVGTTVAAVGAVALTWYDPSHGSQIFWPAMLGLACIPLYALTDVQDGIGRGRGWMTAALIPPYIVRPLCVLICILIAGRAGLPMTAITALAGAVIATWLAAGLQSVVVGARLAAEIPAVPPKFEFKTWLGIALPLLIVYACELILQNADTIVLSMYRPAADVGMYFAACKTMALVMFVHYAVGSAIAGKFATLHARGDHTGLLAAAREAVRWTFWPSFAASVAILCLGKPLLWLFSDSFTAAFPAMLILVVGFLAKASIGPVEHLLNVIGAQKQCALVLVVAAIVDVVANVVLIPLYGITGAATATALSLTLAAILNYQVARRHLGAGVSIFDRTGA